MSLMINQNITSLNAWKNLNKTDRSMSSTMEKLSSGLRINKAADDPSGLVVSEQMRAQVAGLKAAVKNSEKGISMIQTAEGALDKVHSLLDKMRSLALDSANSATNDTNMLAANQAEIQNAIETITRISDNTQYGTKKLLDGSNNNNAVLSAAGGTGLTSSDVEASTLATGNHTLVISAATAASTTIGAGTLIVAASTPNN
ncbi:MAG: flagellin, partial [Deltaproteobacteria bacterium]|nr:flagellin [Deltaproteobacteria bacterium]